MSKSVNGLLEHCKKALANNVKYVYGAKMQVLTRAQIQSLQNTYGKSYVWDSDLNKAGSICCDCSGLISSYTGVTRNSAGYRSTALEVASISDLKNNWNKFIGWGLWLSGHIGVVSDTYGYYYAMDGSARNMVHYPITKNGWQDVIKLCDIDYTGGVYDVTKDDVVKIANDMIYKYADKVYNTIDEVPSWGKSTVEKLINKGALTGDENGLNISYTMLRMLVINDRMGIYE